MSDSEEYESDIEYQSNNSEDESDYDDGENEIEPTNYRQNRDTDLPLAERLKLLAEKKNQEAYESVNNSNKKKKKRKAERETQNQEEGFSHKNAPACMPSNKPVKRLRVDANNSTFKFRDPRFSSISGQLNQEKFNQAYSFLDKHQEEEVEKLNRAIKKTKSHSKKELLKEEMFRNKQQMTERRRDYAVRNRLKELKHAEKEKVKEGKKAFFLKKSDIKTIAMEERYNELKKDGKLHRFMEKKRHRNANKDHLKMPSRRENM